MLFKAFLRHFKTPFSKVVKGMSGYRINDFIFACGPGSKRQKTHFLTFGRTDNVAAMPKSIFFPELGFFFCGAFPFFLFARFEKILSAQTLKAF